MLLAAVVAATIRLVWPPAGAGVVAVSFGITEGLVTTAVVMLLAVAVHVLLGSIGVTTHRGLVVAVLGGLSGAAAAVSGAGLVYGLK